MADAIARSLAKAEALCRGRGAALTPIRRQVLELVLKAGRPVGAYALLADLERSLGKAMPPTVYRALDFLMEQGLVHKIESQNAFVACLDLDHAHRSQFILCTECGRSVELLDDSLSASLDRRAAELGFEVTQQIVEIRGICPDCRAKAVA
jgi:Fur family zinc uptake transcriptional regulator